jgi:sec-independent protein translocase protein TatB
MIDLSWSHILIVLVVALVVVGPKDLPRLMRMVGRWVAKARAMADQFRKSFDEMARQAELDELRTEIEALRRERPFASMEHSLNEPVLPPDPPPDAAPKPEMMPLETALESADAAASDSAPHDAAPPIVPPEPAP